MALHLIETQWHYPIMIGQGWAPITESAEGLVRSYDYNHPTIKNKMTITTGVNADYWTDKTSGDSGYWSTLESHLRDCV